MKPKSLATMSFSLEEDQFEPWFELEVLCFHFLLESELESLPKELELELPGIGSLLESIPVVESIPPLELTPLLE